MDEMEQLEVELQQIKQGVSQLDEWCKRALNLLDDVYKVSQVGNIELQQSVDERVKAFLRDNGRRV